MAHFCWFLKYIFLLLMLSRAPTIDTRPARQSDLIAGNEFLKLFLDHDELQRNLHSSEFQGHAETLRVVGAAGGATEKGALSRATNARSIDHKTRYRNANSHADDSKQVVKLVTTGSKIVFLEEYDDDGGGGGEIEVKKSPKAMSSTQSQRHTHSKGNMPHTSDEVQVLAVSVSTSSKRGEYRTIQTTTTTQRPFVSLKQPATAPDYINRSHKSELSIEEAEPLTMLQQHHTLDTMDDSDSVNSASTNIQNVLAAPLISAVYHSNEGNVSALQRINHSTASSGAHEAIVMLDMPTSTPPFAATAAASAEDKLLPFQTVIYHDSKQGRGPQSRSISYSSISQHVEDLHVWQQSGSILSEAQRNVSESLKPMAQHPHAPEPSKFYSVPSKMYSLPAKFYSEPSKVYSEPAKIYGQAEQVYSEPAKVYSQPSKFYSEPAKVYSQPAKVYGEPAKTYWPQSITTSTTTTTTTPAVLPARSATAKAVVTVPPPLPQPSPPQSPLGIVPTTFLPSRRPAIVSRIAFGEAQHRQQATTTTTTTTMTTTTRTTTTARPTATWHQQQQHHYHNPQQQQQQQQQHNNNIANSQARRVLFNLDKLPYDLLNAPQQSSQHLLEPILSKSPTAEANAPQPRLCWEPATSSLSTSISTSQQQQQQQHSSLSVQHSNQNAKGLPNRDLVKCVSKYATATGAAAAAATSYGSSLSSNSAGGTRSTQHQRQHQQQHQRQPLYTTERNHADDELYTPTPEQNYEIEESVSVMTNGRAHGVQGVGTAIATTTPVTPAPTQTTTIRTTTTTSRPATATTRQTLQRNRQQHFVGTTSGGYNRGRGSIVYNANANANADDYDDGGGGGAGDDGVGDESIADDDQQQHQQHEHATGDAEDAKVAYVVEGRNYRKYRVEEKTDDGFIVGEYGVVDHNDGNLRGVRYTADSTINRSLIQKALLTFLKLK